MEEFWKTPEGKILMYGMHEHVGGISLMSTCISIIEKQIENKNLTNEDLLEYLKTMKSGISKCKESIDYIYKEIKQLKHDTR